MNRTEGQRRLSDWLARSHAGRTINAEWLLATLAQRHGRILAAASELELHDRLDHVHLCRRADLILACEAPDEAEDPTRPPVVLVGVEIKDWAAPVSSSTAEAILAAYGESCDQVYLACRRLTDPARRVGDLGLIDLGANRITRPARPHAADRRQRRRLIAQLERWCGTTLPETSGQRRWPVGTPDHSEPATAQQTLAPDPGRRSTGEG